MRTFIRLICGVIVLTAVAAIGLSLMQSSSPDYWQISKLTVAGVLALTLLVMVSRTGHRRSPVSQATTVAAPPQIELNDRPVMWYKGEVFDFIHNDPTASSTH